MPDNKLICIFFHSTFTCSVYTCILTLLYYFVFIFVCSNTNPEICFYSLRIFKKKMRTYSIVFIIIIVTLVMFCSLSHHEYACWLWVLAMKSITHGWRWAANWLSSEGRSSIFIVATRSSIKYNADSLSGPKAHDGDSPNLYKFVLTTYHVSKCCN